MLTGKGFAAGNVGNNEGAKVTNSQVQAASQDDQGAQEVAKELGGLPIVEDASVPQDAVRVVLSADYTGPGSGLDGTDVTLSAPVTNASGGGEALPAASPIITAGSNDPQCVN